MSFCWHDELWFCSRLKRTLFVCLLRPTGWAAAVLFSTCPSVRACVSSQCVRTGLPTGHFLTGTEFSCLKRITICFFSDICHRSKLQLLERDRVPLARAFPLTVFPHTCFDRTVSHELSRVAEMVALYGGPASALGRRHVDTELAARPFSQYFFGRLYLKLFSFRRTVQERLWRRCAV